MLVSVKQLLESHPSNDNVTIQFIYNIKEVIECVDHYHVEYKNGKSADVYFDGFTKKYNTSGKLQSKKRTLTGKYNEKVRFVDDSSGKARSISMERIVMVLKSFLNDAIPDDIEVLEANLMNSSASSTRCRDINIIPWQFIPDEIEWAEKELNGAHKNIVDAIFKRYGKVYCLSAYNLPGTAIINDPVLFKQWIIDNNIKEVR